MSAEMKIHIIQPTSTKQSATEPNQTKKRRVAAYARVSTLDEEQLNSYENQITYYTNYIKSHPDWEFVEVYSDEGISGLNTKRRLGFKRMIRDARNGKIDLIITKSISRFARNTVDSLSITRYLKNMGVEVYFEKENIHTFDPKGEFLLSILSSIAQEESRSISANVTGVCVKTCKMAKFRWHIVIFSDTEKERTVDRRLIQKKRELYVKFIPCISKVRHFVKSAAF